MTQSIEFPHGHFGRTIVTIDQHVITVTKNKKVRSVRYQDISVVRVSRIDSKVQIAHTLSIEGGGQTLEIDYNTNQARPLALDGFRQASREIVRAIALHCPDVQVTPVATLSTRLIVFACYGIPTLLFGAMSYVFAGDNGRKLIELVPTAACAIVFLFALAQLFPIGKRTETIGEFLKLIEAGPDDSEAQHT